MKPATLLSRLTAGQVLLADGAMGTMLMARGLAPGGCPEAFALEHPGVLGEIARLYLEAGANVIQTDTFGGHPAKLASYGLADRAAEINTRAVQAARGAVDSHARESKRPDPAGGRAAAGAGMTRPAAQAGPVPDRNAGPGIPTGPPPAGTPGPATEKAFVSASCGPCGRLLTPYGDIEPAEVYAGFEVQARAFLDGGADLICVETMTDLAEAALAVRAAKAVAPATPVIATMTFDRTARGFFTIMGVTIERACAGLEEAGADVVGSNCGNGIDTMIELAREFRARTRLPLAFRPNAGLPEVRAGAVVYPETPEFMAARIGALLDAGASIVGGCCGTTPGHVRALRNAVDALPRREP